MKDRVLIWGSGSAPCWRVMIALEEKGLQYESQQIEFSSSRSTHPPINRGTTRVVMWRWLIVLAYH